MIATDDKNSVLAFDTHLMVGVRIPHDHNCYARLDYAL